MIGNLSNLLGEMFSRPKDTFLTALAHDDDDNIYIRKLKNMAEGGIFGVAVDGIGEFIGVLRAAKKAETSVDVKPLRRLWRNTSSPLLTWVTFPPSKPSSSVLTM